ncbi:unnamed protein product [Coregonus sp. 'balchen']|nr:unnamed protein product [Coregonus sp. 'balchen']
MDYRGNPYLNWGAWGLWTGDEEEEHWDGVYHKTSKDRKKKYKQSKIKSFFRRLNTRIMANRI